MSVSGVGTEIVECLRIAQLIERHGELFLQRVFTAREIDFCSASAAATQQYAGRWAAKVATLRAMGSERSTGVNWRDIDVRLDELGRPRIALAGAARERFEEEGIVDLLISIAHCRTHATAYAVAIRE